MVALSSPAPRLFLVSFAALFLELMVIRWVPSEIRLVAYYANLMLVSSFLGLGLGALRTPRKGDLFRWFPPLLAVDIIFLVLAGAATLPSASGEVRFYQLAQGAASSYVVLALVFLLNAAVFVPLGREIGRQFQQLPPLRAYVWDLLGSLGGTLAFGLFSFLHFSPLLGMLLVVALASLLAPRAGRWFALACHGAMLAALLWSAQREATWWSPYYFITVHENKVHVKAPAAGNPGTAWLADEPTADPPAALRTMLDPPLYTVRVNQDFYQMHGTVDLQRYAPDGIMRQLVAAKVGPYDLPYRLVKPPGRVLVLGAGGGMDVETALLRGARHVDAVEIDPVIARLSNRYSAARPYARPEVTLHIDDARAFLQRSEALFDLVVFGHLDSQALFSYGASLRLDGYTYTVEGFRAAFARVAPRGAMAVSFVAGRGWMTHKLAGMIEAATGAPPIIYARGNNIIAIATNGPPPAAPAALDDWRRIAAGDRTVPLATDDWPYLYLERRGVPADYAIVIGLLLLVSLGALAGFRGGASGPGDAHFLFLGWGFLLLQTKSIGDCSLYFGTTWLVTTLVIAGVLLMVLLANGLALRRVRRFRLALYAPLFASLLLVFFVPRETILAQPLAGRVLWTLLAVPLPIFFAGLIFSTTFRESKAPALAFGANLMGATIGGFCEYLGMWVGSHALGCLVLAAYAASLLCCLRGRRAATGLQPAAGAPATMSTSLP